MRRMRRMPQKIMFSLLKNKKTLFIIICLFFLSCVKTTRDEESQSAWYISAEKYIEADKIIIDHSIDQKESFTEDFNARSKAKNDLLNATKPTDSELEVLLQSNNLKKVKIGLVTIMIKKIYSEKLFNMIPHLYSEYEDYWLRFYSIECFKIIDDMTLKQYEDKFLDMILKENNGSLLITCMPLIIRFDESKQVSFFVNYMINGNPELQNALGVYLCRTTSQCIEKVREQILLKNANALLKYLECN